MSERTCVEASGINKEYLCSQWHCCYPGCWIPVTEDEAVIIDMVNWDLLCKAHQVELALLGWKFNTPKAKYGNPHHTCRIPKMIKYNDISY